jgi:hypothetical protein
MEQENEARQAEALGLTRLWREHPDAYRAALNSASALRQQLPKDLAPAEESAHVFHLAAPAEARR